MNVETPQLDARYINQGFVNKIEQGRIKEAQDEGTAFIRVKMRQTSFAREIVPPVVLADDEIDRDEFTDLPKKIVEKEPESEATFVTFKGTGKRRWFSGPRYAIHFGKVESDRFVKSKFELMTYQNDIRKILTDNSVKDMADQEDTKFMETVNALCTGSQHLTPGTGFVAGNFVNAFQYLLSQKIPIGKILMTKELYYEALNLQYAAVGSEILKRHYDEGIEAEEKLWGIPVVTTIKRDIISPNDFYVFGPQEYLGNFFLLQDATLFIKQEADIIEFWSYSAPGIGIGNSKSMIRVTLTV
jgi:hypothetical protein